MGSAAPKCGMRSCVYAGLANRTVIRCGAGACEFTIGLLLTFPDEADMSAVLNRIEVLPQSGWTGAEIVGVDLREPLSEEHIDVIRRALHKWNGRLLPGPVPGSRAADRLRQQFGEVTPGHSLRGRCGAGGFSANPYRVAEGVRKTLRQELHAQAQRERSGLARRRHAADQPARLFHPARRRRSHPYSGDTQFTNVAAAYQGSCPNPSAN